MHTRDLRSTLLIHENFGLLMTFAFSQPALTQLRTHFHGSWKYLDKMCFELPRTRAERAALELAIHLRMLNEEHKLEDRHRHRFGTLFMKKGATKPLLLRELTNKVIHSNGFEWDFKQIDRPKLICLTADAEKWQRAEIDLVELAAFCGELMS